MSGSSSSPAGSGPSSVSPQNSEVTTQHTLNLWKNGFQLDDGELKRYDDPSNAQILSAINEGNAPRSLFNVQPGQLIELRVANRMSQECIIDDGETDVDSAPASNT